MEAPPGICHVAEGGFAEPRRKRRKKRKHVSFECPPHPSGIRPFGNALFGSPPPSSRSSSAVPFTASSTPSPSTSSSNSPRSGISSSLFCSSDPTPSPVPICDRVSSLGLFNGVGEQMLVLILSYLDGDDLCRLSLASKALYAFTSLEELWIQLCTERSPVQEFRTSWRHTWLRIRYGVERVEGPESRNEEGGENGAKLLGDVSRKASKISIRLDGFCSDLLFQKWVCRNVVLHSSWLSTDCIPKVDGQALSAEVFVLTYEKEGRPVILTDIVGEWPACRAWNDRSYLRKQLGDRPLAAGHVKMSLFDFYLYADSNQDECPLFIFDPTFADPMPLPPSSPPSAPQSIPCDLPTCSTSSSLAGDYSVPPIFLDRDIFELLPHDVRPQHRWLLIGNRGSGSKWHIDPNNTNAWNAVVSGAKRWLMLPPGCPPPGVFPTTDGAEVAQPLSLAEWYTNFYEAAKEIPGFLEGTVRTGEVLFIPSGWWHCVLNTQDNTIAVTHNYSSMLHVPALQHFLDDTPHLISGVPHSQRSSFASQVTSLLQTTEVRAKIQRWTCLSADGASKDRTERPLAGASDESVGTSQGEGRLGKYSPKQPVHKVDMDWREKKMTREKETSEEDGGIWGRIRRKHRVLEIK